MYASGKNLNPGSNENIIKEGSLRQVILSKYKERYAENEVIKKIYKSFHQEYIILAEFKMIYCERIPGVYVIPSKDNPFVWFGVIFVRSGPYQDGIFRFNVILDENFPDSDHPKVVFSSEISHPVIHEYTNELHLLDAFPTWNKNEQHIWQILKYIHWIFHNFNASLAHGVNKNIIEMYKENYDTFTHKIEEIVKNSQEKIYDHTIEDAHYLLFEHYKPSVHDKVKKSMLQECTEDCRKVGHSWVLPGNFKPLTRPLSSGTDTPDL